MQVYEGRFEGPHLRITITTPNAYSDDNDADLVVLDIHSPIPPMQDKGQLADWLLWRLLRIESHECREFFKVKGLTYADPHQDGADRDL